MPDGPRYDDDFYAWTQYQAEVLRTLRTRDNRLDRENLVEEVESLGRSQRDAVGSQVERILLHFLKLAHSPAANPRLGWMDSIVEARSALNNQLSPSLRRDIEQRLPTLYAVARKRAALQLQMHGEAQATAPIPAECLYTIEQVLTDDWYPAAADSANGDRA